MGLAELDQVARVPTRETGYIYILTNPSMPGMRKIGYTSRSVYQRIKQLNSTGVPTPFRMERYFAVPEPLMREIEKQAHYKLGRSRVKKGREFFRASAQQSFDAVTEAIRSVTGTEPHDCVETYRAKIATERAALQKRTMDMDLVEKLRREYIQTELRALDIHNGSIKAKDSQLELLQLAVFVFAIWFIVSQSTWVGFAALFTALILTILSYGHTSYDRLKSQVKRDAAAKYPFSEGSHPSNWPLNLTRKDSGIERPIGLPFAENPAPRRPSGNQSVAYTNKPGEALYKPSARQARSEENHQYRSKGFQCSNCDSRLTVSSRHAKRFRCPKCQSIDNIPIDVFGP